MPQDRPHAPELLAAVRDWLSAEYLPTAKGGAAFSLRVAINVLGILEREWTLGPTLDAEEATRLAALLGQSGSLAELNRELCRRIRAGEVALDDPALRAHLLATTNGKLRVANPSYSE